MPKDNIDRAIKKAIGNDGDNYEEIRYEGYGPGGVAIIVETLTDNRNRTASNVRSYFSKSGGALGETDSVAFMFDRVGDHLYRQGWLRRQVMLKPPSRPAPTMSRARRGHYISTSQAMVGVAAALEARSAKPARP